MINRKRRTVLAGLAAAPWLAVLGCAEANSVQTSSAQASSAKASGKEITMLKKSKQEWKQLLDSSSYTVLFEEATERPFTSPLNDEKREGTFLCAACRLPLFASADKFDSGTGWPSFTRPIDGQITTKRDFKLILPRTEYHCARCGGHQGHVFNDGPAPTGQRWCNNGVALTFVPAGEPLPELRS